MSVFLVTVLIGISLSMDAFSLALLYGTIGMDRKSKIGLSIVVGVFHFFMPLIGEGIGGSISHTFSGSMRLITLVIFCLIGVQMLGFGKGDRDDSVRVLNSWYAYFLFGFSVSIDSLTVGLGISSINNNFIVVSLVFCFCSFLFTFLGLNLGNFLSDRFGGIATKIGGGLLILLGIFYYL